MDILNVITILNGITEKERLLILRSYERYNILYDLKKQVRKIIILSSEVRNSNNELDKTNNFSTKLHYESLNLKNVLKQFNEIYDENEELELLKAENNMNSQLRELLLLDHNSLLELLRDKNFEETNAGKVIKKIFNNIIQQNKFQCEEFKLYEELKDIINNFRIINEEINNLIRNMYIILDFYSIIMPTNEEQYLLMKNNEDNLKEFYKMLKGKIIEEKDNVIKPLLKLIDNKYQIINMIKKLEYKTLITAKDIKKDISSFSTPEETREYLSRILSQLKKVEDPDYVMRLLTKLGLKVDSIIRDRSYKESLEAKNLINIDQSLGLNFLYTKNYLSNEYLKKLILEVSRSGNLFSIVFFDIDNFKGINDNYGHTFGDNVLKYLLSFIRTRLRINDEIFRYGGEEFIIVLKGLDNKITFNIIDKIRQNFNEDSKIIMNKENLRIEIEEQKKRNSLTFSAGISTFQGYSSNKKLDDKIIEKKIDELIKTADTYMYESKNTGKNRVVYKESVITL